MSLGVKTFSPGDKELKYFNIDSLLNGSETREPVPYYGIYKVNMLVAGGSGSGKSSFCISNLLNDIFDVPVIVLFAPYETIHSGFWKTLAENLHMFNFRMLIFDISKGNIFSGMNVIDYIKGEENINVPIIKGFPELNDMIDLRNRVIDKGDKTNCSGTEGVKRGWLLIFDDFISSFQKNEWLKYFRYIHNVSRMNSYTMSLVQSIEKLPPQIRGSYTVVVIFTNYLPNSVVKTLIKNCLSLPFDSSQVDELISITKQAKGDKKHEPLILIGSTAPVDKSVIYNNKYIVFE